MKGDQLYNLALCRLIIVRKEKHSYFLLIVHLQPTQTVKIKAT